MQRNRTAVAISSDSPRRAMGMSAFPGRAERPGARIVFICPGDKQFTRIPDVATFTEQGINGVNVATWFGLVSAAKTPRAIIDTLNAGVNDALRMPEIRQRFEHLGLDVEGGPPEKLGAFIKAEADSLSRLIKAGALRVD